MERTKIHHQKHRFHTLVFRGSLFVMAMSAASLLFFMNISDAASANINFFLRIGDPPVNIETHPPVAIIDGGTTGGGRLSYLVQQEEVSNEISPSTSPAEVTINMFVDGSIPEGGAVSLQAPQTLIPNITSLEPLFKGSVGVGESLLFVELHFGKDSTITASFNVGKDGTWEWRPPHALTPGSYVVYVTAFDPTGKVKLGSATLQFEVTTDQAATVEKVEPKKPRTDVVLPLSLVAERKVLFDVRVNVLEGDTTPIQPGDDILAQVSLLNIGSPGYIVDAEVHYQIINNTTNVVLFEESETIGVSTQASYLKTFSTKSTMHPGRYRLEVSVSYGDTEAYTTDQFSIGGTPVIATTSETHINVSTMMQILFIVLTLALLIMYTEYHTMEILQGVLRQVSEVDLKKSRLL